MFNPLELIVNLNWEESGELEFKSAKGGLPKSLWETYSAMANTHGGVILLGVEDNGEVSGVVNVSNLKKTFWDTINNPSKVNTNLLTDADIIELSYHNRSILAIRVPQATRYQRPIYLNQHPWTGTYRRNHEGDYRCNEKEIRRMFADCAEESADSRMLENFDLSDVDLHSLQQYRQRLASYRSTHPWLSEDDKGLLIKLGGWHRERKTDKEGLTVAGLLMFGKDEAIREALPNYHIDYRENFSSDPSIRWTDRITADGTWVANLFQFYFRIIQRLSVDLKLPFQLDANLLRKGETPVHEAIREALVNTLIHGDYYGVGGILVEKRPDRLNFSNPGTFLISLDQLLRGNVSECRNKYLQNMFMLIGAAEKAGSGIDKMRKGWRSQSWQLPVFHETTHPDRVYCQLPMISLIPPESMQRLKSMFGIKFDEFDQEEIQILVTADMEGFVDNARIRQITGSHAADITRTLQKLVAKGVLVQEGQARWSRYRLPTSEKDSVHMGMDSVHMGIDSVHMGIDSVHMGIDSVHIEQAGLRSLTTESAEKILDSIAAPARENKRLVPKAMEKIILDLCTGRWLSRRQLADLLDRHHDGLRTRFLTPMVGHGLLRLRYPDKPNRVDQAYTINVPHEEIEAPSTTQDFKFDPLKV